ncbi:site-2 protease family protein [Pontibacter sp. HSC-36F09]|uniref:site-2 protease family protein n=1 Tax=Pontibacter sp. HSC-36F09 TaxID=2910966 RepID=UPI00209CDB8A|nr:site-2 protease family protein [Pontibacter sp. HSC-36F09]MCP2043111.1 Zn-dependent protease/CBS domain-containing protein [Pontibacter sp. HSC-36F09]
MKWSLNLGRIAGIKILMHWTFLILIGWIVFSEMQRGSDLATTLLSVAFVLTIFLCVVLHELGHALMAKRYGVNTKMITLLPIGGVASLERIPENPKKELMIAVAGPAVNVVIAFVLWVILPPLRELPDESFFSRITPANFLYLLFFVNMMLVVFNAIPAFPMDGGRVLRALLAFKLGRVRATQIAANLGQMLAIFFMFIGFFYNPFLILIGIFVFFGAWSENIVVQHIEFLRGHLVREGMMTNFVTLAPSETVRDALGKLLKGSEHDFVVEQDGEVMGTLTRMQLIQAVKEEKTESPVSDIMTQEVKAFNVQDKLAEAYTELQKTKAPLFPVLENGRLAGVINSDNINEFILIKSALAH